MTIIKPSFLEAMFYQFFNLDPDRPMYYMLVFRLTRSIFMQMGFDDKADKLQIMIDQKIESKLKAPVFSVLQAYYTPRFYMSRKAYCKIGEGVDTIHVTRYELTVGFEEIKNWCYDEVTQLTPYVRFTQQSLPR